MRPACRQIIHFALLYFSAFIYSQGYLVHQYTEIDGLPSSVVKDVAQDKTGQIWVATRSGISVYNGATWRSFNVNNGLPVSNIHTVKADSLGAVWLFSYSAESNIWKYDGSQWTSLSIPLHLTNLAQPYTSFEVMSIAGQTRCAVGTMGAGVFSYQDDRWTQLTTKVGLPSDTIYCLTAYENRFYIGTTKGLAILQDNEIINWQYEKPAQLGREITGIAVQDTNRYPSTPGNKPILWLKGNQWIGYLIGNQFTSIISDLGETYTANWINGEFFTDVLQPDYHGGLYWGHLSAVYYISKDARTIQHLSITSGLTGVGATSMLLDQEMNLWIGSLRGLSKLPNRRFANYQQINGLLEDEVTAVIEPVPGQFIFGHNDGITFFDGIEFQSVSLLDEERLPPGFLRVMDLEKDTQGNVWAALQNYGIAFITPAGQIELFGEQEGLHSSIYSTFINRDGNVYAGGGGGLFKFDAGSFRNLELADFPTLLVRSIAQGPDSTMLIMTLKNGLLVGWPGHWQQYTCNEGEKYNSLYSGLVDYQGHMMIGSAAGLLIVKDGKLVKFTKDDFQINRPVYFLVEDLLQQLWIGTDIGVVRWDGKQARQYTVSDGLIGHETNRAAGLLDSAGRIWIGTDRGVSLYQAEFDNDNLNQPKVQISYIKTGDMELSLIEKSRLKHDQSNLDFYFSVYSYIDENNILIKRQLEGLEDEWRTELATPIRKISYFSIPPGKYQFKLQARNAAGVWSEIVTSPEIIVLKPFWMSWWFYFLCIILITGVIYIVQDYFNKKHFADRLQIEVHNKTKELEQSREKYSQLFELCPLGVAVYDRKGNYLYVNPAYCVMLKYDPTDLIGKNYINITILSENITKENIFLKMLLKEQPAIQPFNSVNVRSDGKTITVRYHGDYTRSENGKISGFVVFGEDVTERLILENQLQQAQKMEAIGQLAGGVAHDFNNLLAAIVGYSELGLKKIENRPAVLEYFKSIIRRSDQGAKLVRELLAFSRKQPLRLQLVDLNEVVTESSKFLNQVIGEDIELKTDLTSELALINADSTALNQIITNLCINARDAMPNGGKLKINSRNVKLDYKFRQVHQGAALGEFIKLQIIDNGSGMDEETRKQIFDPFFTTKPKWEGAGLGLSMIFGLMKQHKGYIDCTSQLKKGTTFNLYFPVSKSEKSFLIDKPENEKKIRQGKETILLVEDDPEVIRVCELILAENGYAVLTARDGSAAMEIYSNNNSLIDLVMTDVILPHMSGIELYHAIRKTNSTVKFLFMSGYTSSGIHKKYSLLPDMNFLKKPFREEMLLDKVRQVLER